MKEFIEIPFGAKDSELGGWEYNIPEGYTASIENGKIVVKKEKNMDEKIRNEICIYIGAKQDISLDTHNKWLAWLEKQGEQNPAWSEDDELYLEDAIHAAKELYYANCGGDELVDWLKSLKDRVQPQPQKEWSEEDERMRKASIRACQYMVENFENSTWDYEDAIDWLNSLKNCVQPQWKPSEEQMAHLVAAIEESDGNCILQSLYNDLKKL